jgi:AraC family transcriptional regulator
MERPLQLDWSRQHPAPEILPNPPLLTSHLLRWRGIEVQQHRQPAWDSAEVCFKQHVISIHNFPKPARSERRFAGQKQSERLGRGDVVIMPAGVPHADTWDEPGEFTLLIVEPNRVVEAAFSPGDAARIEIIPQYAMRDPFICGIGAALQAEMEAEGPGTTLYAEHLTAALAAHLIRKYSSSEPLSAITRGLSKQQLQRALDFIHDNLGSELSVAQIAAAAYLSQYHFARLFKLAVGVAPHQYIVSQRIHKARLLLSSPELSVEEISWRVGFSSQSHFTAQFRRLTGMSPGEYRRIL